MAKLSKSAAQKTAQRYASQAVKQAGVKKKPGKVAKQAADAAFSLARKGSKKKAKAAAAIVAYKAI
ncbi:MAG: hypothetical protein ACFHXK_07980 [bacterium]